MNLTILFALFYASYHLWHLGSTFSCLIICYFIFSRFFRHLFACYSLIIFLILILLPCLLDFRLGILGIFLLSSLLVVSISILYDITPLFLTWIAVTKLALISVWFFYFKDLNRPFVILPISQGIEYNQSIDQWCQTGWHCVQREWSFFSSSTCSIPSRFRSDQRRLRRWSVCVFVKF